jgi:DNA-directed RNA polymerase subunit L
MGRNRLSVTISDEAKEVLVGYQMDHRIKTRDDATEALLFDYEKLSKRVKELEAQLAEAKKE